MILYLGGGTLTVNVDNVKVSTSNRAKQAAVIEVLIPSNFYLT